MRKLTKKLVILALLFNIAMGAAFAEEKNVNVIKSGIEKNANLTMSRCIDIALTNNPAIKAAISNTHIYDIKIGIEKSKHFPKLSLSTGFSRLNNSIAMPNNNFIRDNSFNSYELAGVSVNQLISDFGKTGTAIDISKDYHKMSKHQLKATKNNIVFNVKRAYYQLLLTYHNKKVIIESVKVYKQHLDRAKAFYKVGTRPKIDVLTAEVNLSNARLQMIQADNDIDVAIANLNRAMGISAPPEYTLKDQLEYKEQDYKFDEALNIAYEKRPDYKSAVIKTNADKKYISLANKIYFPDLKGSAGYSVQGLNSEIDPGWNLGFSFQIPVFNAYSIKKQVDEAKAGYKKDLMDAEAIRQSIYYEIKEAHVNFIESQRRIPVAKVALSQAKESYDLASGRYNVGEGDPIELKDAELTYRNVKLQYYRALHDYNVAVASLERAIGKILPEDNEDT